MLKKIEPIAKLISSVGTIASFVLWIISIILGKKIENPEGFIQIAFEFLYSNRTIIWICFVSFAILYLSYNLFRINRLFTLGFKDNFKSNLPDNWDAPGDWRITENHELFITNSDCGGITKKGANWENYTMTFDAKIVNLCLGIVVRARDLNNYYMFQINKEQVRPHRRVSIPIFKTSKGAGDSSEVSIAHYRIGWQIMDNISVYHLKQLNDWFKVKVKVTGQTICIQINNDLVFHRDNFLELPNGKIGFRNDGNEQAIVKKLKVIIN